MRFRISFPEVDGVDKPEKLWYHPITRRGNLTQGGDTMNKAEIMTCAAILTAGLMASRGSRIDFNSDDAVQTMVEIAGKLQKELDPEAEREYRQI